MHAIRLALALVAVIASSSPAQVADHLKCYRVKDAAPRAKYTADLTGLAPEPGCVVKVPASFLCVEATKTNVTPTPPGGGPSNGGAGRFLCYKIKCAKAKLAPVAVNDQFGRRTVTPGGAQLLCAPEGTTTTSTSTTATTAPCPTTTTLGVPNCGGAGCNLPCLSGQACLDVGGGQCACGGPVFCGGTYSACGGQCPSGMTCTQIPVPPGCGSIGCICQ